MVPEDNISDRFVAGCFILLILKFIYEF